MHLTRDLVDLTYIGVSDRKKQAFLRVEFYSPKHRFVHFEGVLYGVGLDT